MDSLQPVCGEDIYSFTKGITLLINQLTFDQLNELVTLLLSPRRIKKMTVCSTSMI